MTYAGKIRHSPFYREFWDCCNVVAVLTGQLVSVLVGKERRVHIEQNADEWCLPFEKKGSSGLRERECASTCVQKVDKWSSKKTPYSSSFWCVLYTFHLSVSDLMFKDKSQMNLWLNDCHALTCSTHAVFLHCCVLLSYIKEQWVSTGFIMTEINLKLKSKLFFLSSNLPHLFSAQTANSSSQVKRHFIYIEDHKSQQKVFQVTFYKRV